MKTLVVTMGITGSGKSTWLKVQKNIEPNVPVVETDDLRVELLGDVDDITQEKLIFDTAAKRISELFNTHDKVLFGATLVDSRHRLSFLQSIKDICTLNFHNIGINMVIFPCDPKVSKERITRDLKAGVKRADSIQFIDEQFNQYSETMDGVLSEDGKEIPFYNKIDIVFKDGYELRPD